MPSYTAHAWIEFDLGVRPLHGEGDRLLTSPAAPRFRTPHERQVALALCHPDGRIREAALRHRAPGLPALLPLVAVRCSDWAAPVRERARALLRDALPGLDRDALAEVAAVALCLVRGSRGGAARDLVTAAVRDAGPADLVAPTGAPDRQVRRLAIRTAVRRGLFAPAELAELAARSGDVAVQEVCAEAVLAGTDVPDAALEVLLARRHDGGRRRRARRVRCPGRGSGAAPPPARTPFAPGQSAGGRGAAGVGRRTGRGCAGAGRRSVGTGRTGGDTGPGAVRAAPARGVVRGAARRGDSPAHPGGGRAAGPLAPSACGAASLAVRPRPAPSSPVRPVKCLCPQRP